MRRAPEGLVAIAIGLFAACSALQAQQPLRVLTWLPRDIARPTYNISITFDRPVAGSLDHAIDATRIVRIDPAIRAKIEWRDPSTIRVIPLEPLLPGHRYDVTVDSGFSAFDGNRLAAPVHFALSVRGPALMGSYPQLWASLPASFNPTGRLLLTFSAPVPDSLLTRTVRYATRPDPSCPAPHVITYRIARHRPLQNGDPWELTYRGGMPPDAASARFREVVELMPEQPLPESCAGDLSIPSLDSLDAPVIRYPVNTPRPFQVNYVTCGREDCATAPGITVEFNAPVTPSLLAASVHVDPAAGFAAKPPEIAGSSLLLAGKLEPRHQYRVTVDSTLRDVYDRPLTRGFENLVKVGDRLSDFGFASGLVYVPSDPVPTIRVHHVNVDTIALVLMPVPDSLRVRLAISNPRWYEEVRDEARRTLRDTIVKIVALHAPLNVEGVTDVKLPELAHTLLGRLVSVQARLRAAMKPPAATPRPPPRSGSMPVILSTINVDADFPTPKTLVQASALLAHARLNSAGGAVWITSAVTGRAVRGATVTLLDSAGAPLASSVTDASGVVHLAISHGAARLLDARLGPDRSITDLGMPTRASVTDAELRAAIDSGYLHNDKPAYAALFTDRGIYRPGESVNIGATVREGALGSLTAPRDDSVQVRVERQTIDGSLETVRDTVVRASRLGTIADKLRLAADASLGDYSVKIALMRAGKWEMSARDWFRVSEFRAAEFLTTASADTLPHLRGDAIVVSASAAYLFGAPMAGARVRWSAVFRELSTADIKIPGLGREWTVGEQGPFSETQRRETFIRSDGIDSLNDRGSVRFRIGTDSVAFARGARATIEVSVADLSRQVVTSTTSAIVHPASLYVALGDSSSWQWPSAPASHRLRVMAVRTDGARVAGVRVRMIVIEHRYTTSITSESGVPVVRTVPDTIRIDSLVTGASPRIFTAPATRDGWVEVVATALDERGRIARTTLTRYSGGGTPAVGGPALRLPLHLDRARLAPGDTAVVTFVSPWSSADAWVTLEREGILSERVLRAVRGTVTVRLPITGRDVPNAFVSVLLLRGGRLGATDSLGSRMRTGYAILRVDDAVKRLAVQVRALNKEYEPGDSASIEVTARDSRHRAAAADVTVWAVDEGVLALTGYVTPDPMGALYAPVSDGVSLSSTLRMLPSALPAFFWRSSRFYGSSSTALGMSVAHLSSAGSPAFSVTSVGRGNPLEESLVRGAFRSTAFFASGVRTGTDGIARVTVKLPDNTGTFRLMAVATGAGDAYGSAEAPLLITKALVVRAALPRFIRAGDSVFAGAVINARDRVPRMIDVTARATNVTLAGDNHLSTMLAANGTEVRFAWRVPETDSARFRVGVFDGKLADAVVITLPVKPDQTPRAHTITGMIGDTATVRFRVPRSFDTWRSRITIRSGTSPVPALLVARDFLLKGSYSCPDELTSAGRMLVSLLDLERRGVKVLDDTLWARRELQHIANEIERRVHANWIVHCWEMPWEGSPVRAAANLLLLDMRDIGIQVEPVLIERIGASFGRLLDTLPLFPDTTYGTRDERAWRIASRLQGRLGAIAFLRRTGSVRERDLQLLYANEKRLTWEDRAWLAQLLEEFHLHAQAYQILGELWSNLGQAGNRVEVPDSVLGTIGFPSHIRPIARLLSATLAIAPDHPRLGALVERLTTRARVERDEWWNTQDHVSATVALASFAGLQRGRAGSVTVHFGPAGASAARAPITLTGTDSPRDSSFNLMGIPFAVRGDSAEIELHLAASGGSQYYAITFSEMTRDRPTAQESRGLTVERWYERFDDGRAVTEAREGELVRVRLRVTALASRDFVALEDILPSGLESVDFSLLTTGSLGPFSSAQGDAITERRDAEAGGTPDAELYGSWLGGWWSPWSAPEHHDDRTVFYARKLWPGSFTLTYVARATTAGRFVRPQAHAEEAYNRAVGGSSEGGWFDVRPALANGKP